MMVSQRYSSVSTGTAQAGKVRIAGVLITAILLTVAMGALAAPRLYVQDRDRDRDRDRGWDRGIWISREYFPRDFGGGGGGRPSPDAVCPENSVAVGFHVQTGEYFNTAWLECAPVRPDGDIGEELRATERTGTPGGRPVHDAFCPRGFALRGLRGRTGGSIDEAAGMCSPLRDIVDRFDRPRIEMTQPVMRPNPGGHPVVADCPPGSVVTGFRSNSGEYMDHLWLLCSEVRHRDRDRDRDDRR